MTQSAYIARIRQPICIRSFSIRLRQNVIKAVCIYVILQNTP